jgi:hypothetical protein
LCRASTKDRTSAIVRTPDRRRSSERQLREGATGSEGASSSLRSAGRGLQPISFAAGYGESARFCLALRAPMRGPNESTAHGRRVSSVTCLTRTRTEGEYGRLSPLHLVPAGSPPVGAPPGHLCQHEGRLQPRPAKPAGESQSDLPADPAITTPLTGQSRHGPPQARDGGGEDPDRPKRHVDGDAARFVFGQHFGTPVRLAGTRLCAGLFLDGCSSRCNYRVSSDP